MSARKVCLNCPTSYYTGKEQSPLHFGLSAEGYEINSIMEGFDKDLWIVEVRNNKKVWTKKEHINKMTYEIPLISETTPSVLETEQQASPIVETAPIAQVAPAVSAVPASDIDSRVSASTVLASTTTTVPPAIKEKVSKTIKPTDYTLFITYRIHQMKEVSGDNKRNYDCAREEWKDYKKKPDELREIMVEANLYHQSK